MWDTVVPGEESKVLAMSSKRRLKAVLAGTFDPDSKSSAIATIDAVLDLARQTAHWRRQSLDRNRALTCVGGTGTEPVTSSL
jgi:hypothetical protein